MTDLHPAAKPEHVRQVLDNLKALERSLRRRDVFFDNDEDRDDARLVGKAIIVIESLGRELDKRDKPTNDATTVDSLVDGPDYFTPPRGPSRGEQ